jgi:hypothetical protein
LHDVVHVFGFVVEHCSSEVSEGVEVDFHYAWVAYFAGYAFALVLEGSCVVIDWHLRV